MLVDSHCHLDLMNPELDRVGDYLDRARGEGVEHFLCVAVSLENAPVVRDLAQHHAGVYASVGVHPNHDEGPALTRDELTRLAGDPQIVAVGETGLDYFRNPVDAQLQQERLRIQVRSARDVGKPLIIHMREATEDTLRILDEEGAHEVGGVMHCFVEDYDTACRAMELGFYISFSGIVTFRNAEKVRDAARRVPDERLLVETDSPYLAPVPHRGKPNEPAFVREVAECVAGLRDSSLQALAETTSRNFFELFRTAA